MWISTPTPSDSVPPPCCGCRWSRPSSPRSDEALADRPEVPFVAATTGSTNLVAALLCQDDRSLYEYITGEIAALDGLTHIETAPVMRAVKMHATMTPPDV